MFGTFGHQDPFVRQGNTFGWPHTTQTWSTGCTPNVVTAPHTFGLFNSSLRTISQSNEIRLSRLQQPFGQQKPIQFDQQKPIPFGQAQLPFGQQAQLPFGQAQLPFGQQKPLIFGQTQPAAQPNGQQKSIQFVQQKPILFDQAQPAAHIPISKTALTTRIVLVNPLQQNYDHMSGEEYLLLNDLSLSLDYCQKLQRELQIKMNS